MSICNFLGFILHHPQLQPRLERGQDIFPFAVPKNLSESTTSTDLPMPIDLHMPLDYQHDNYSIDFLPSICKHRAYKRIVVSRHAISLGSHINCQPRYGLCHLFHSAALHMEPAHSKTAEVDALWHIQSRVLVRAPRKCHS